MAMKTERKRGIIKWQERVAWQKPEQKRFWMQPKIAQEESFPKRGNSNGWALGWEGVGQLEQQIPIHKHATSTHMWQQN